MMQLEQLVKGSLKALKLFTFLMFSSRSRFLNTEGIFRKVNVRNDRLILLPVIYICNIFFSLQEVEQLRQEKLEIDEQLRSIHGTNLGSMQSLPMGRRNDRGYNSDMDGGGRPRGSMRGRGGRGRGGGGYRHNQQHQQQNDRYNNSGSNFNDYVNNVDRHNNHEGNGKGRGAVNGRPPRGGAGGNNINRERSSRGRLSVDSAGGGDRERK